MQTIVLEQLKKKEKKRVAAIRDQRDGYQSEGVNYTVTSLQGDRSLLEYRSDHTTRHNMLSALCTKITDIRLCNSFLHKTSKQLLKKDLTTTIDIFRCNYN